jgi:dTDP-4-dehydrorhamnose 3,5-epimerase
VNLRELSIPGLYVTDTPVWGDDRGFFREWFKTEDFRIAGVDFETRQANLSVSKRNTVRGLHYSLAPEGQAKVVTCVFGEIDDVIVDIRVGSPTYGAVEIVRLVSSEGVGVVLPAGVAHGFSVISEEAALAYLLSSPYNPSVELEIDPFDPMIDVPWRLSGDPIVSAKDSSAPSLRARHDAGELPAFETIR